MYEARNPDVDEFVYLVELGVRDLSATMAVIAGKSCVANSKQNTENDRVEPIIPVSLPEIRD